MYEQKRIRYEYFHRPLPEFLKWFYQGLKAHISVKIHNTFSHLLGPKKYLNLLKKIRSRKLGNSSYVEIRGVRPESIKYISPTREEQKWFSTGKLKGGNWDKGLDEYNDLPFHRAMVKRIEKGLEWDEIEEVKEARKGGIKWPGKPYKVDRDIEKTEELLKSIKQEGYKTQEELRDTSYEAAEENWDLKALNEVCVDLDRNGNPLFVDGRHRLSIAKILGLEKIPVRIVMRHKKLEK